MVLELEKVTVLSGGQTHLYGVDLHLVPGDDGAACGWDALGHVRHQALVAHGLADGGEDRLQLGGPIFETGSIHDLREPPNPRMVNVGYVTVW